MLHGVMPRNLIPSLPLAEDCPNLKLKKSYGHFPNNIVFVKNSELNKTCKIEIPTDRILEMNCPKTRCFWLNC